MPNISVRRLYQDNQHKLSLSWVASRAGSDNLISNEEQRPTQALVGHLNFIHPNRVQVLGLAEVEYLNKLEQAAARTALDQLFHKTMAVVIVANGQAVPKLLHDYCQTHNVPLMSTPLESPYLMDVLRIYLARALAAQPRAGVPLPEQVAQLLGRGLEVEESDRHAAPAITARNSARSWI